ncbi:MAG: hypothetical protein ACYC0Q_05785 [Eubacteriales bacterium]
MPEWCNEHSNNHNSLLYAASSLTLEGLLPMEDRAGLLLRITLAM